MQVSAVDGGHHFGDECAVLFRMTTHPPAPFHAYDGAVVEQYQVKRNATDTGGESDDHEPTVELQCPQRRL